MQQEQPTVDVPEAQFINYVVAHAKETGEYHDDLSDQAKDKIGYDDVFSVDTFQRISHSDDSMRLFFETETTVSEQVARRTHSHPAEYKNHDVSVLGVIMVRFDEDNTFSKTIVEIEQDEYPTDHSPAVDVNAHRYDL